jgi:subtilisin family serine protease
MPARSTTMAATAGVLCALLGASSAIADDLVDPNDCLKAVYTKGIAELIITPSQGNASKLKRVLTEADLDCAAQLQVNGACLVPIDPRHGKKIRSIADSLQNNIYALKAGSAPKDTQDAVASVTVNSDFGDADLNSNKHSYLSASAPMKLSDPLLNGQIELAALHAKAAWFDARQSNVLTAIIDTGVRVDHEDLSGQFLMGTTIGCRAQPCDGTPDYTSSERHHGTRTAGILAAKKGNEYGGAGIAWNTQFMSINYMQFDEFRTSCALQVAIAKHADIVNASWMGGSGSTSPWNTFEKYARMAADRGILIVFAAGNDGVDLDRVIRNPAELRLPNMLTVMAYNTEVDEIPDDSNFGLRSTQIAAPNYATVTTCIDSANCYCETESWGNSWSAAYVSGAAALLKSRYPSTDYDFLKWRIIANATPEARFRGKNQTGGRLNLDGTIFPVFASLGGLSRKRASTIDWKKGIRADMCSSVSIEGRPVIGDSPGNYFQIVASTPNDGVETLSPSAFATIDEDRLQLRVSCINANPIAESAPLPLN